ncbi:MAG: putative DNA binding domain-containing protein [Candidatus Cloacimonetes bacterium]|nr:putative DNA binding domain-containing protein [Candidatus Cloacimonadota bacterium]
MKENQNLELKESWKDEYLKHVCAFANSKGGQVVIGVDNNKSICGISLNDESIQNYINQIKNSTYPQLFPDIEIIDIDRKKIIFVSIAEYPIKPIACRNRYFKRVKNSNHILSTDEIVNLQQQSLNISYNSYKSDTDISEIDLQVLNNFISKLRTAGRITLGNDELVNFKKLKLIKDNYGTKLSSSYEEIGYFFIATLTSSSDVTDHVTNDVTDRLQAILEQIKENDKISTNDLAKILHVTKRTILRDIKSLKKQRIIERIGTEKTVIGR